VAGRTKWFAAQTNLPHREVCAIKNMVFMINTNTRRCGLSLHRAIILGPTRNLKSFWS